MARNDPKSFLNWENQLSAIMWAVGCPDPKSGTVLCDIEGYNQLSRSLVQAWDDSESLDAFRVNALTQVFRLPPPILARPSVKLERILQTVTLYFERYRPKNHAQMVGAVKCTPAPTYDEIIENQIDEDLSRTGKSF